MPAWPLRFQLAEQRLSLPRTAHPDEANMTILRILHVGQIASAILPPGFQRPEDNGFPAAERTAKALAVARARPQLLMPPRPARRPPYRLAQRAPETIIYPDHQIHRTPFNAAAAIVIAIQHPARRGRRGGNGGEKCLIRRALPVRPPVQAIELESRVIPACAPGAGPKWICLSRWCRPR